MPLRPFPRSTSRSFHGYLTAPTWLMRQNAALPGQKWAWLHARTPPGEGCPHFPVVYAAAGTALPGHLLPHFPVRLRGCIVRTSRSTWHVIRAVGLQVTFEAFAALPGRRKRLWSGPDPLFSALPGHLERCGVRTSRSGVGFCGCVAADFHICGWKALYFPALPSQQFRTSRRCIPHLPRRGPNLPVRNSALPGSA